MAGDPQTGYRWARRSLAKLRKVLAQLDHRVCCNTIRRLLIKHKIRPKSNRKRLNTTSHPLRDTQFQVIQREIEAFKWLGQPIISVDAKKRELIGKFAQAGQVWSATPTDVNSYDFPSLALGKAIPYGVYDVQHNDGFVGIGQSGNTAELAVDVIRLWWGHVGQHRYPHATDLLILCDGGGSNDYRSRLWKQQLQLKIADEYGVTVTVAHYPTGASKWNPIEHRLFSQISKTWAGTPLTSLERLLDGIRQTTTKAGLSVQAQSMTRYYPTGIKISDAEMQALKLERHTICPQWNYAISPRQTGTCF